MIHSCHATSCQVEVPREMFMCTRHWHMVPKFLRSAIWRNYRVGQCDDMNPSKAYCEAARNAVVAVATKEGIIPDTRLYDILIARR